MTDRSRRWYEIVDEIKSAKSLGIGTLEAMVATLDDADWERLLVLMQEADDFY